jgi:hypothetical protein
MVDPGVTVGIGVAGSLSGVGLGWWLNRRSAASAAIEAQRRDAAVQLLNALVEARMHAGVMVEAEKLSERLEIAKNEWRRALLRYAGRLDNQDLTSRIDEVYIVLFLATQGGLRPDRAGPEKEGVDLPSLAYLVERAFLDVFVSLDAFLNGKALPPRSFPNNIMEVITDESRPGGPIDRLRAELNQWPDPERTARTKIMMDL